jgi:hypothetical protein
MLAPSTTLHAQLVRSDTAVAAGITARGTSPVLLLCRKLLAVGHDPATPMQVWRGNTLCLSIRSIDAAAGLRVNTHGTAFIRDAARPTGPPIDFADHLTATLTKPTATPEIAPARPPTIRHGVSS